jgi:nucleotide-binding universal stress UspA family protein
MDAIKKILLLTDFSDVSENATLYALQLAKKSGADVRVLNVVATPVDWVKIPLEKELNYPETRQAIKDAKQQLKEIEDRFERAGVNCQTSVSFNLGVENIVSHINHNEVDLVVMGSHGASGIKEFTIGSNAQKILRAVKKPLLVVKNPPKKEAIESIVFASSFEDQQLPAFKTAVAFAYIVDLDMHLLHINTPYNFTETHAIEKMMTAFCQKQSVVKCQKHCYSALNEERGMDQFMSDSKIDLFAIATSGKSGLRQLFNSSLTERLVNHLDIPVLSIHL